MVDSSWGPLRSRLPRILVYVVVGLVLFTVVRVAALQANLAGWRVNLLSVGVMLLGLELLTRAGVLTTPFSSSDSED